jgi:2-phospho-L-lactate/phosphoenolpyruvate guanylyltransferase
MTDNALITWSVLMPVKVLAQAKSRLAPLAGPRRAELALALACDTVAAALGCDQVARVVVITDDQVAAAALGGLGALVIPDEPRDGLNAALRHGAAVAAARWPGCGTAALSADLPALRPGELGRALKSAAAWPTAFVADAAGDGTTLYTAVPGAAFRPAFGLASRARHAAGGAAELEPADIPGLRRDVDTPADLRGAAALGLGPCTAPVAAELLRCAPQGR